MSRPYLITFKPLGFYFFGSYLSFKEGFFVVSNRFPQQTAILGCLRSTLLKKNDLLDEYNYPDFKNNTERIHALTGTSKMNGLDEADDNFGVINKISPVFLVKNNDKDVASDFLFQAPWDVQLIDGQIRYVE
jgi:CRISPR-associated protein Cmr3